MSPTADSSVAPKVADRGWKVLYVAGAGAALIAVTVFRRNLSVEVMQFGGFGIIRDVPSAWPSSAMQWFTLLQEHAFVGLVLLNLVDVINYCLVGLMFLAVYGALRRDNPAAMMVATVCVVVGIGVYLATNQALSMLSLSKEYAAAATEARRSALLGAGEALLAVENPGVAIQGTGSRASFFLVVTGGLIISIVMLRSSTFRKAAAVTGILANGIRLCGFAALLFAPSFYSLAIPISAPFRVVWYVLIALKLFQLA